MLDTLATGRWLTAERLRQVPSLTLLVTLAAVAWLAATARGTRDWLGRPLGTDFSDVYSAGLMARHDRAAEAWDWAAHHAVQQAVHHDPQIPFYGWHYPPPFLLVAVLLAGLPYVPALIVWQVTTLGAAFAVMRRIVPGRTLATLGAPIVLVCLGHGQNAFLTAALIGGGLLLLDTRPFAAGLLFGCLVYKPQFAVLLPVLLLAAGRPRAVLGAGLSAALLILATLALWGWPIWSAFLHSLPLTRTVVIEQGATGWEKIESPFAAARAWGATLPFAYALQTAVAACGVAAVAITARLATPGPRNATFCAAALLSTPYVLDYDLTVLGLAVAFLVADGRARGVLHWEASSFAFAWAVPLFGRSIAQLILVPLGTIAILAVFVLAVRRAMLLDGLALRFRSSPCRR